MKNFTITLLFIVVSFFATAQESEFYNKLSSLDGVSNIEKIKSKYFFEKYKFFITQPLDHDNKNSGTFQQQITLCFRGENKPTVFVTEGYTASYTLWESYNEELATLLDANIVACEHRFFGQSAPKTLDWQYLTIKNASDDLHAVNIK